jgi:ferric-dicitrate binding protein FerR (iron transport regulator)
MRARPDTAGGNLQVEELLASFPKRYLALLQKEAMHEAEQEAAEKTRKQDEEKERMFQRMQSVLAMQQHS